jgi:hypothetical protein
MASSPTTSRLANRPAFACVPPVVGAVGFGLLPMPINLALLLLCASVGVVLGVLALRTSRGWGAATLAFVVASLLLPRTEARLLDHYVRTNLHVFQRALPVVVARDKMGCASPSYVAQRLHRCSLFDSIPLSVRPFVCSIRVDRTAPAPRVFFQFRCGSRQVLLYDPSVSEATHAPYRSIGNGWHLSLG